MYNDDSYKNRDWSTDRAAKTANGAIGSGNTKETHVRCDGIYVLEKNCCGDVVSVKKGRVVESSPAVVRLGPPWRGSF
jgi:hypothetical protein